MKFETYLLLALLVFGIWRTQRGVQQSRTVKERQFSVRVSIFGWFVGFLLLAVLLVLPLKLVLLLLIPLGAGIVSLARLLRDARDRLRREMQAQVDAERMKRVN